MDVDYLDKAKVEFDRGGQPDWAIAAALISIAESHKRVADALEESNRRRADPENERQEMRRAGAPASWGIE